MNNNNYPTWLVPLDIAKELKEIGFNEPCLVTYHEVFDEEIIFISFEGDDYCYYYAELSECSQRTNSEMGKDILETGKHYSYACSIPTWTEVFAWFRKRGYLYGIENEIYYDFKNRNQKPKIKYSSYFETVGSGVKLHSCTSESYEEAREELVKDLIEIYREELLE